MKYYRILKFILLANKPYRVVPVLIRSFLYILFCRVWNKRVISQPVDQEEVLVFPDCHITSQYIYSDFPDKREIQELRKYSSGTAVFLDIGANVGTYSVLMKNHSKDIIAFEPHPLSNKRCKLNFLNSGIPIKNVFDIGLSNKEGGAFFTDLGGSSPENKISETSEGIPIKLRTIDSFLSELGVTSEFVIKIDVEGHEKEVFEGAINTLSKTRAIIFEHFSSDKSIVDLLADHGFKVQKLSKNNYLALR